MINNFVDNNNNFPFYLNSKNSTKSYDSKNKIKMQSKIFTHYNFPNEGCVSLTKNLQKKKKY